MKLYFSLYWFMFSIICLFFGKSICSFSWICLEELVEKKYLRQEFLSKTIILISQERKKKMTSTLMKMFWQSCWIWPTNVQQYGPIFHKIPPSPNKMFLKNSEKYSYWITISFHLYTRYI